MFKNMRLSTKISSISIVLLTLTIALSLVGYIGLETVDHRNRTAGHAAHLSHVAQLARQHEKDYMLYHRDEDRLGNQKMLDEIKAELTTMHGEGLGDHIEQEINALEKAAEDYGTTFHEWVEDDNKAKKQAADMVAAAHVFLKGEKK